MEFLFRSERGGVEAKTGFISSNCTYFFIWSQINGQDLFACLECKVGTLLKEGDGCVSYTHSVSGAKGWI